MQLNESQRKEQKRLYDMEYRRKNKELLKLKKAQYFQKDYRQNPDKYKAIRSKRMKQHVQYCRQESYKEYKMQYDLKSRWGEYWECWSIINEILQIVLAHYPTKYERLRERGYYYRKYGFAEPIGGYYINNI